MNLKRNIKVGLINILFLLSLISSGNSETNLEGNFTEIKILNKISSKNVSLELKNNEEKIFDDLIIKSIKCKNSEFDDDPEIISYIQVIDQSISTNDEVLFLMDGCFLQAHLLIRLIIQFMIFGLLGVIKLPFHYLTSQHYNQILKTFCGLIIFYGEE